MTKKEDIKYKNNKKIILGVFFILTFVSGWFLGHQDGKFSRVGFTPTFVGKNTNGSTADFSTFWRAWDLIEKNYDGTLDYEKMVNGAIEGMVNAVGDPYTNYLSPEDAQKLSNDLSGIISGIGAEVGLRDNRLVIIAPIDESPAKKAGLLPGDYIVKINDESTAGMDINTAVSKIRGEAGTKVKIVIDRAGVEKSFEITRETVTVKSVKSAVIENSIGHITISRFDEQTTDLVRAAIKDLSSKNIKKIVLDMRDNPGGYLNESVTTASLFIKDGVIVTEKKDTILGKKSEYKAIGGGPATSDDVKIVVLINGGSASASEIVAGALKDRGRATLVGEKSYGKGSVQEIENLSRGAKLKITIAHWYTPNGRNIGKEGIEPDVLVKMTEADYVAGRDPQLAEAVKILKK